MSCASVRDVEHNPSGEDVTNAFKRDRAILPIACCDQYVQRWSLGDDAAMFQKEQSGTDRDGLGGTVSDIEHRDRQISLDKREAAQLAHCGSPGRGRKPARHRARAAAEAQGPVPVRLAGARRRRVSRAGGPTAVPRRKARPPQPTGHRPGPEASP